MMVQLFWGAFVGTLVYEFGGTVAFTGVAVTATGEAAYYHLDNNLDPWRVLAANLGWYFDRRPGWIVLAICLGVTMTSLARVRQAPRSRQRQMPGPVRVPELA